MRKFRKFMSLALMLMMTLSLFSISFAADVTDEITSYLKGLKDDSTRSAAAEIIMSGEHKGLIISNEANKPSKVSGAIGDYKSTNIKADGDKYYYVIKIDTMEGRDGKSAEDIQKEMTETLTAGLDKAKEAYPEGSGKGGGGGAVGPNGERQDVGSAQNELSEEIFGRNEIKPDFNNTATALSEFVPWINWALGIICTLIVCFLTVFTATDVCYIVFPAFRNTCEEAKQNGNSVVAKKDANGNTKLRIVSDEAVYAVQNCSLEQGKNPLTTYLAKRVLAFVLVAIILFILLTGNIQLITNLALKVVSGIMEVLKGFG